MRLRFASAQGSAVVWWSLGLSLAIAACGTTEPTDEGPIVVRRGVIKLGNEPVIVDVPPVADSGVTAVVTVITYGLEGCFRAAETRVSVDGLEALIEPYDTVFRPGPDEACVALLGLVPHDVPLVFHRRGEATITIRGLEEPSFKQIEAKRVLPVR